MSNESDSEDTGRRRRRRKGGGLRVPSDNVPRRSTQQEAVVDAAAEPAAPAASDDPHLAVSLAPAFGPPPEPAAPAGAPVAPQRVGTASEGVEIDLDDDDVAVQSVAPAEHSGNGAVGSDVSAVPSIIEDDGDDASTMVAAGPVPTSDGETGASNGAATAASRDAQASAARADDAASATRGDQPSLDEDEGEATRVDAGAGVVAEAPDDAPAEALDDVPEESVVDEADAVVEEPAAEPVARAVGATIEPGDPSDSGELLTDDLLEEFDEPPTQPMRVRPDLEHRHPPVRLNPTASATAPAEVPAATDDAGRARAATVIEPVEEIPASDLLEVDDTDDTGDSEAAADARQAPPAPPPAPAPKVSPPPPPAAPAVAAQVQVAPAAAPAAQPRAKAKAKAPAPAKRRGKPWFEEIFDEDYLRTLPFLTPQATQRQARFVLEGLGVEPGSQVLDVGCGYGRHAMELAARGHHIVGLDLSLPLLIRGADEAQRRGLTINFVHGDMREIQFESQFDGAYCLFSTFGYFDDETNKKVAKGIARALKPGAKLVLEVLNRDYLVTDLPSRVWWEGDGCVVLEEVEFNYFSSRIISNRSVVFDDGRQLEQEISMRAYALHELGKLLHAAGFRILEVSGSMDTRGRFFGVHSRELVVIAERRAAKEIDKDSSAPKLRPPSDPGN